jgi:hypothetical protein
MEDVNVGMMFVFFLPCTAPFLHWPVPHPECILFSFESPGPVKVKEGGNLREKNEI